MSIFNTVWQASDVAIVIIGSLVFFFCFGFSLWKAMSASQATIYWHVAMCFSWAGIVLASIAGSRTVVWATTLNIGYALLAVGIIMTLAGIAFLALHHFAIYRDRDHHAG